MEDSNGDVVGGGRGGMNKEQGLEPVRSVGSNRYSLPAATVRDTFKDYFSSPAGEVSWQYRHVNHNG